MARWGPLLDDALPADGLGLILPEPGSRETMERALADLRRTFGGHRAAFSSGILSFTVGQRLGAAAWLVQGPPKDRALDLFQGAGPGDILAENGDRLGRTGAAEGGPDGPVRDF
jgi:hypothetical protein